MRPIKARLSRQELYEKIWRIPAYKIAEEFGVSPNSVANVCRAHKIPVPSRNYWLQIKAHGKAPRQPLPNARGADLVEFFGMARQRRRIRFEKPDPAIQVPAVVVLRTGPLRHPLALRTERLLHDSQPDDAGILISRRARVEHLRVSSLLLPRALRILDALFIALGEPPFGVKWGEAENERLGITVLGEYFRFQLVEVVQQRPHRATATERIRQRQNWLLRPSRCDYKLTRQLQFIISDIRGQSIKHRWSDAEGHPLEGCVQTFLVKLIEIANELKKERGEIGSWRKQWDQFRALELERDRKGHEDVRKLDVVRQSLSDWAEAQTMREFVSRLRRAVNKSKSIEERQQGRELIRWVKEELRSVDPLRNLHRLIATFSSPASTSVR